MIRIEASLSQNFFAVYKGLVDAKLVPQEELEVVGAWINDVNYFISK
jgi:hypothetical protein